MRFHKEDKNLQGLADLFGHIGMVHGVNVYAVRIMGLQILNLPYGVINAGFSHIIRRILISGQQVGHGFGDAGSGEIDSGADHLCAGDGHDTRLHRYMDTGLFTHFQKPIENIVVEEQLADEKIRALAHLMFEKE